MILMSRFCKVTSRQRKRENRKEVERKERQPRLIIWCKAFIEMNSDLLGKVEGEMLCIYVV